MVLRYLSFCLLIACASAYSEERTYELTPGLTVVLDERRFERNEWRIDRCGASDHLCRINGKVPFGVDGTEPVTYLHSLILHYRNAEYSLDTSNMFNAWRDRPVEYPGTVKYLAGHCSSPRSCVLRGIFSDAAGSFVAEWQVRDGLAERTILTNSADVVSLFIRNIDPPRYE